VMFKAPIFLDSDELFDLNGLLDAVRASTNVVILLTPNVLSRPWCLLELVTAVRCGANIVPVVVARPGPPYVFPDEAFYQIVCDGMFPDASVKQLLDSNGIDGPELAAVFRVVFSKIALTFSPHRSTTIRHYEVKEIVQRCQLTGNDETDIQASAPSTGLALQLPQSRSEANGFAKTKAIQVAG